MGGEANGTVRAEIYSFLDLISKNVMKLKAKSRLRIYSYSRNEIKIHMDNMHSEVTNLLLMMGVPGKEPATEKMGVKVVQIRTDDKGESALETQVPRNFDFLLKSILKSLKQIYALVKDDLDSKLIYEPVQETRDSLTKMKVDTEIKAKETDEAPQKFSMDAVSGENGMDKVSRGISTHGLEIEEDKETSKEAKRMDEVSPEAKLE
uniref:Uncharacterized protein n=1 Tax=Avena sativa TaxID=4498 RepID=A0ACD5UE59_AVESA